jgi:hypothetical protein
MNEFKPQFSDFRKRLYDEARIPVIVLDEQNLSYSG